MSVISIIVFVLYLYGFGHTLTRFLKDVSFETVVLRLGVGLGVFPFLILLLNLIHVPLDWRIFLVLSLLLPLHDLLRCLKKQKLRDFIRVPSKHILLVLGIFFFSWGIYSGGSFVYPWLENDDPWTHAAGIKYVAVEKNLNVDPGVFHYINPYPPGYDAVLGIIHQTHPSIYWVMKFFNGMIIAFGFLFFYLLAHELTKNKTKAVLALFFLACIPSYLSHFIWAHALAVTLFFPAFYLALKARQDKRFILPGSLVVAGILLTQPTQSIKFIIMFVLLGMVSTIIRKGQFKNMLIMLVAGIVFSMVWWGPRIYDMKAGNFGQAMRNDTYVSGAVEKSPSALGKKLFDPYGGSATRAYGFSDYFVLRKNNMINNPIGVGPVICLLALWGIFYCALAMKKGTKDDKIYSAVILLWSVFTFLGMNSATFHLPVGLFAFRFWMLFAIPLSFLAAEAFYHIVVRKESSPLRTAAYLTVVMGVLLTSGFSKFKVNTSIWPWGVYWNSPKEVKGYVWLRHHLRPNTKVFAFADNLFVIGNDMRADFWTEEYKNTFEQAIALDSSELHPLLVKNGFQFLIIDERTIKQFGAEAINKMLSGLFDSGLYKLVYNIDNSVWVFEVLNSNIF